MMVPQPTAQYGQVDRVSLARAIFRVRNCAYAGFRSNPKTAAAAPPIVVNFRKSRRGGFMLGPPSTSSKVGRVSQKIPYMTCRPLCQAVILPTDCSSSHAKYRVPEDLAKASKMNCQRGSQKEAPLNLILHATIVLLRVLDWPAVKFLASSIRKILY